jgi:diaminohydroxyphosphoribosylaminopyrimidine deaminase/5-amino-6-(5-phosphoribosylamino)uracil reductase
MQDTDQSYMLRAMELAHLGAGRVAPNPMVGAVLVHHQRIIGEGWHEEYGKAHAEVNCINSVLPEDQPLIPESVMYVTLEPCAHFGKTPPCSDLIIKHQIPKVIVGCTDPFPEVAGKGIRKMQEAGIEAITGFLEKECIDLNKRFFTWVRKKRPYIILKWAQTANGKIAGVSSERLLISNEYTNRKVHQWRSEEASILVGTHTALQDDPALTNRLWTGKNPVRMVLDLSLCLPPTLKLFDQEVRTIVFNAVKEVQSGMVYFRKIDHNEMVLQQILDACYQMGLQSILVEGGSRLLKSFIELDLWDEARIISNENMRVPHGLAAPVLHWQQPVATENIMSDEIRYFSRVNDLL